MAVAEPHGNGFIAVFVCAITLGLLRPDVRECFESRSEELIEVVKLGIFVVFGSLLISDILFSDGWAAVAIVGRDAARGPAARRSSSHCSAFV